MKTKLLFLTAVLAAAVGGCASTHKPAPEIVLDAPIPKQAEPLPDPPKPVTVVPMPQPLPLPGQLKPLDVEAARPEATDPRERVTQANQEARVPPTRDGYLNAVQVWPSTKSLPAQAGSPTSCCRREKNSSPCPPETLCAGSSVTRPARAERLSTFTFSSSRYAPT